MGGAAVEGWDSSVALDIEDVAFGYGGVGVDGGL